MLPGHDDEGPSDAVEELKPSEAVDEESGELKGELRVVLARCAG